MSDSLMSEKYFLIYENGPGHQEVLAHRMGRILMRSEVDEIVDRFNSEAKRTPSEDTINIVPPIAAHKLPQLGEALVQLAITLDPTDPVPTYSISPEINLNPKA